MCNCLLTCLCPNIDTTDTSIGAIGAWSLGRTRPDNSAPITAAQYQIFRADENLRSYAFTLSPKGVGIMAHKNREMQYTTLKRCLTDVLKEYKTSYIINYEIYPSSDNDLHLHGIIRFKNHTQKEKFKKDLKNKITQGKKGTFPHLIDCEFVNDFDKWIEYITKSQEQIIKLNYFPLIHIDYSLHSERYTTSPLCVAPSEPTFSKKSDIDLEILELENKLKKLKSLKKSLKKNI